MSVPIVLRPCYDLPLVVSMLAVLLPSLQLYPCGSCQPSVRSVALLPMPHLYSPLASGYGQACSILQRAYLCIPIVCPERCHHVHSVRLLPDHSIRTITQPDGHKTG